MLFVLSINNYFRFCYGTRRKLEKQTIIGFTQGVFSRVFFYEQEVPKEQLAKLINNKHPGPDEIKGEFFKCLKDNDVCIETITKVVSNIIEN